MISNCCVSFVVFSIASSKRLYLWKGGYRPEYSIPNTSWSALFHTQELTALLCPCCYANGDSQTSPHSQSTLSSETIKLISRHTLDSGQQLSLSMVQNFYVTLLYKLETMIQQQVVVQLQGTAVSLGGRLETVIRLNFRVFSITINTITSRSLSAITTDQTAFTLQWLFQSINNTFITQPQCYQPVNSFISIWWKIENNVCYRPGLKVV